MTDAVKVLKILKQVKQTGKAGNYHQWKVLLDNGAVKKAPEGSKKAFLLTAKGQKLLTDGSRFYKKLGVDI